MMRLLLGSFFLVSASCLQAQITMQHLNLDQPLEKITIDLSDSFDRLADLSEKIPKNPTLQFDLPKQQHNPFFCALEDKIQRTSGIWCKFRLGSVQYVDALEGKSYFQAVANSQTTQSQLRTSRK